MSTKQRPHQAARGNQARYRTLAGAACTLAGAAGTILVTSLRRPAAAPPAAAAQAPPDRPAVVAAEPEPVLAGGVTGSADQGPARPISLVVGFDDSGPARRALAWGADLLRARLGSLHVIYADRVLADGGLSGLARAEMEHARSEKAASVAAAAAEIATTAGVPYTFERRRGAPADAILLAASLQDAAQPATTPVIVIGRSHGAAHQVIGSVPVRLLHESPYPVLTIS